jgi:hypothetical protein
VSYNGSGTFNINTAGQPVVTGTVISSTAFNALTADLGTGLSTAITKDGQTVATARIPFAAGINSSLVTDATSTTTGSIITAGGVGIAKALYVGTTLNVAGASTLAAITGTFNGTVGATTPSTGAFTTLSATGRTTVASPTTASGRFATRSSGDGNQYNCLILESYTVPNLLGIGFNGTNWCISPSYEGAGAYKDVAIFSNNSKVAEFLSTGLAVTGTLSATGTGQVGTTLGVGAATPSASGAGITFPATDSPSTNVNTLDDYEEGTFLHGISFGGAAVGITYNANYTYGFYTKIGRVVHVLGTIILTSKGSSTGLARITGLPFTSNNTLSSCDSAASLSGVYAITFTNIIEGEILNGTNTINLNQSTSVGGNTDIADTNFGNTSQFVYTATYFT